jgi:hypothetical protein
VVVVTVTLLDFLQPGPDRLNASVATISIRFFFMFVVFPIKLGSESNHKSVAGKLQKPGKIIGPSHCELQLTRLRLSSYQRMSGKPGRNGDRKFFIFGGACMSAPKQKLERG